MKKIILYMVFVIFSLSIVGCEVASDSVSSTEDSISEEYTDTDFEISDWTETTHSKSADPDYTEVFSGTEVKRLDIVVTSERWQSMLDNMTELYGEFGSTATTPSTPTTPIGAPTAPTTLITSYEDPIFVPAEVYYDGIQWYKVGVRFKGNSSLKSAWENGILKLSFKLDFDEFEDEYPQIDNQRFYGFKKLSLKNNYDDKSFLREKVAADVFREAGLAVSNTAFYTVYVDHGDGPEYFGLYTLVEEISDTVIDSDIFDNNDGNLYKPEDGSANFVEGTFSSDDFEKKTNEDDADWSDIEALFSALHATTRTTDPLTWRTNLEAVFDVQTFLKYLSVNGVIQNWDTYGLMIHNYYLYNNNGKLTWIPWDNNEAFQEGKLGGALDLDFTDLESDSWPLIAKIYADSEYKANYDEYVQEVIDGAFNSDTMQVTYDSYSALVKEDAIIERDGFTFLDSSLDYTVEFDEAINILKLHATERKTIAEAYLNGN